MRLNCLYVSLVDLGTGDGYDRKTVGQISALEEFGWRVRLVCFRNAAVVTADFHRGDIAWHSDHRSKRSNRVLRRILLFSGAVRNINKARPRVVYLRYPRADFLLLVFLISVRLAHKHVRVLSEIPTYPFDAEKPRTATLKSWLAQANEFCFRRSVSAFIDAYSVVAYEGKVFGRPSIRIENGIDNRLAESLPAVPPGIGLNGLNLVFVANFNDNNRRHGIDRLLRGLDEYYSTGHALPVRLRIVGNVTSDCDAFEGYACTRHCVIFYGRKSFSELIDIYKDVHLGVGCLGFHRIGVTHTSALKEREYLSFGIPVLSSSSDYSFGSDFPYRLLVPSDDGAIDIRKIVTFVVECYARGTTRHDIAHAAHVAASWPTAMASIKAYMER